MLFPQLRRLVLGLALFLLWPTAAIAQSTADLPKLSRPQVQIKVDFVVSRAADVDNLGINFDLVPLTPSSASAPANHIPVFLQFATGNIVAQMYQTLTRTYGPAIASETITVTDNTAAVVRVNAALSSNTSPAEMPNGFPHFPQMKTVTQVQGELTLIPHIHPDNSVTLALVPDAVSAKASPGSSILLRTVPSGEMLVLGQVVVKQDIPILGGLFRTRNKINYTQELLIFITPTIVGQKADQ